MEIGSLDTFLDYFDGVHQRTRRVVERIPAEKIDWSPGPGRFSLGDLVRHLAATERFMFAENVAGRPSRYPGHGSELADGHAAVLAYQERMHAEAMAIFRALSPERLREKCETPGGVSITVWKWLRAMVEHEIHHRGQIYALLGELDVETPPLYGLTETQVRERSLPPEG